MTPRARLIVTQENAVQLYRLIRERAFLCELGLIELFLERMQGAKVVSRRDLPPNVVTMNSRVLFEEHGVEQRRVVEVVYPSEARVSQGRLSVLSHAGLALFGASAGTTVELPMRNGRARRLEVQRVLYQPETEHAPPPGAA